MSSKKEKPKENKKLEFVLEKDITRPVFTLPDDVPVVLQFNSDFFIGKKVEQDKEAPDMADITLISIDDTDLPVEQSAHVRLIVNAVLKSELDEAGENVKDNYYRVVRRKSGEKRYRVFEIQKLRLKE